MWYNNKKYNKVRKYNKKKGEVNMTYTLALDAAQVARDNGNPRGMNVVLLGALIQSLGITNVDWPAALKANVKPQFVEGNLRCLEAGMKLAESIA